MSALVINCGDRDSGVAIFRHLNIKTTSAKTRELIRGFVNMHMFLFCPTNFLSRVDTKRNLFGRTRICEEYTTPHSLYSFGAVV